ncbi:MAG TPA: tRNA pseudouridine(55) synthase, partial [Saprospiraceae bacterium]|nr:tRNA pseudouridine(55) synthase [Saprospiraceae bacterium]
MNLEIINTQNIGKIDLESEALFLIDKPTGWTSFDVVNKLRYTLRRITGNKKIKVGHAGTLDPMATGLLLVCSGKATKKIDFLQGMP